MLALIAFIGSKDPVLALLFAIAFIMSLLKTNYYGEYSTINVNDYEPEGKVSNSTLQVTDEPSILNTENDQQASNMNNNQCLNECAIDEKLSSEQCTPISAFNNELNAQGMNCPIGGFSNMAGTAVF